MLVQHNVPSRLLLPTTTKKKSSRLNARKTLLKEPIVETETESIVYAKAHVSNSDDYYDITRYLPIAPGTISGIMIP